MSVYEQNPEQYNERLAEALKQKEEFKMPEWAGFVKTGISKERPPAESDFWYKRAASILRQLYINKLVGVGRLRTRYGSKQNRGGRPEKFKKASGKIIRIILQQAETAGLVEQFKGKKAGRRLTEKGKEFLDSIKVNEGEERKVEEVREVKEEIKQETEEKNKMPVPSSNSE